MRNIVIKKELQEYKNIKFEVELEYYYDDKFEDYYVDVELGNKNLKKIRNEYRRIQNLLSDEEIKNIRNKYGLSQRDYSLLLGFGEITITRYESKIVQEKAHDLIMKESENPIKFLQYVERNKDKFIKYNSNDKYNELLRKIKLMSNNIENKINSKSLIDRGNTIFRMDKLKAVIKYISQNRKGLTKTILAKILWYCDFLNFKKYNKAMVGLPYVHQKFGAYPMYYDEILSDSDVDINCVYVNDDYEAYFINGCKSNYKLSKEEKEIIKCILKKFENYKTEEIVDYMHKENAYINTNFNQIIPYSFSETLSI